jgi:TPR repeat protein
MSNITNNPYFSTPLYPAEYGGSEADAEYELGLSYKNENGEQAFLHFEKAAALNHPRAKLELGHCYLNGRGVEKNIIEAINWYQKAREVGIEEAEFDPRYEETCAAFSADYNNHAVDLIKNGNHQDAIHFLKLAEECGNIEATCKLGICYMRGLGVPIDREIAFQYFQKAAAHNYSPAKLQLGDCYVNGRGVQQNYEQAKYWYNEAVKDGVEGAEDRLARLCYRLGYSFTHEEIDLKAAKLNFELAAKCGSLDGMYGLAYSYLMGHGVDVDDEMAYTWFKEAADLGHEPSQQMIAGHHPNRIVQNQ